MELRSALQTAESSQRGYLYTSNEIYRAPYDAAKTVVRKQIKVLEEGMESYPELKAARDRLRITLEQKLAEMDESIGFKRNRDESRAKALIETNRGKALMDEANVFLKGMIRAFDQRSIEGAREQQENTSLLRWVSIVGAIVILGVATVVIYLSHEYTRGLSAAQLEVVQLNIGLEQRVNERVAELASANQTVRVARDHAEALLSEVNHRIANSLSMISAIVSMQASSSKDKAAKSALGQIHARIHAMSLVHRNLYTSSNSTLVDLESYLGDMVKQIQDSIAGQKEGISIKCSIDRAQLPISSGISLGVIVNEWISNALKYAYPSGKGEIRIVLRRTALDKAELTVSDDGIGIADKNATSGTGFGKRIVKAMASNLNATEEYISTDKGTIARLTFTPHDGPMGLTAGNPGA